MILKIIPSNQRWKESDGSETKQVPEYWMEITREELGLLVSTGSIIKGNIRIKMEKMF